MNILNLTILKSHTMKLGPALDIVQMVTNGGYFLYIH